MIPTQLGICIASKCLGRRGQAKFGWHSLFTTTSHQMNQTFTFCSKLGPTNEFRLFVEEKHENVGTLLFSSDEAGHASSILVVRFCNFE